MVSVTFTGKLVCPGLGNASEEEFRFFCSKATQNKKEKTSMGFIIYAWKPYWMASPPPL